MQLPNEEWDDAITEAIPSVNGQLMEDMGFIPSEVLLDFHSYSPIQEMNEVLKGNQTRTLYLHLRTLIDKVHLNKIIDY